MLTATIWPASNDNKFNKGKSQNEKVLNHYLLQRITYKCYFLIVIKCIIKYTSNNKS